MSPAPPCQLSAAQAVLQVRRGQVTVTAILESTLERIEERDPVVQAWAQRDVNWTRAEAARIDRHAALLPLAGLTIGIKDIADTAKLPTAYGSPVFTGHRPDADAWLVARLTAAGALVLGKTVTCEFATYHPGATTNPHHAGHTPGGSSSGSAAAVADRQAQTAMGTQTAGSVIRPASFCGTLGYKASYARFSYDGVRRLSPSLDSLGFFARDFDDFRLIGGALSAEGGWRAALPVAKPRLGFIATPWWPRASAALQQATLATLQRLRAAGAEIEAVTLPGDADALVAAQMLIMAFEAATSLGDIAARHWDQLSPPLQQLIEDGRRAATGAVQSAYAAARRLAIDLARLQQDYDGLLTPSALDVAPVGLASSGDPLFCRLWTMAGLPCAGFPVGRGDAGLPLSLQVIGRSGADERCLDLAEWALRQGSDWSFPIPR